MCDKITRWKRDENGINLCPLILFLLNLNQVALLTLIPLPLIPSLLTLVVPP